MAKITKVKFFFIMGILPQKVTGKGKTAYPGDAANEIATDEPDISHPSDTSHKRSEGPDNGDKAGDDDCLTAMFFIELMGFVQILFVKKTNVFLMKDPWSHKISYYIIGSISENCGKGSSTKSNRTFISPRAAKAPG